MNTIHIAASREYDVLIGHGLLDELGTLAAGAVDAKTAAIVSDDSVFALYGKRAAAALSGRPPRRLLRISARRKLEKFDGIRTSPELFV